MEAIKLENVSKSYGDIKAVKNLSLNIVKGETFGIVGPDGAGKTTTIRMIMGLISPGSGMITVNGISVMSEKKKAQKSLGYLSQKFSIYPDLSIDENIGFFAKINGVTGFNERRDMLLELTGLINFRNRPAGKLSGGMKQKLALCCALIHKPEIILLDEPTVGVDPVSRRDFWEILSDLKKDDITIFMSTPYLDEAERCNRVALINKGEIIISGEPGHLKDSVDFMILEVVPEDLTTAREILIKSEDINFQMFGDKVNFVISKGEALKYSEQIELPELFGIKVNTFRIRKPNLENIFIHLIKDSY
ncbi:MAG: ABC transporter ATP-binding protein [Ignavibacteriaceae bacterium]|nr:ABC transporter ATP-binding protein [Ignavibacteriaceae bacterium]